MACYYGHFKVAKWLLEVKPNINISANYEYAFIWTCANGYLNVAKWLLEIKPNINISADNEYAFKWSYYCGYLEMAKLLLQQNPQHYYIFANNNSIKLKKIYSKKNKIAKI
jgi:ankyrin repeat protein